MHRNVTIVVIILVIVIMAFYLVWFRNRSNQNQAVQTIATPIPTLIALPSFNPQASVSAQATRSAMPSVSPQAPKTASPSGLKKTASPSATPR